MNPKLEKILQKIKAGEPQTLWFDIDGTSADTDGNDYVNSIPDEAMITLINALYDMGNTIVIVTSRGTKSGGVTREAIENQMREWNLQHHRLLIMRRDFMVDDSTLRPDEFLDLLELPNGEEKTEAEDMDDITKEVVFKKENVEKNIEETAHVDGDVFPFGSRVEDNELKDTQ